MKIQKNTVISLAYNLKLISTGDLIEEVKLDDPMVVLFGMGHLIEPFEKNIEGLEAGNDFHFELEASSAFGERNEKSVIDIPKSAFLVNGEMMEELLVEGQYIPIASPDGSEETQGLVVHIDEDSVLMDFNHPLAGQAVVFDGTVVAIRKATAKEIEHEMVEGSEADS